MANTSDDLQGYMGLAVAALIALLIVAGIGIGTFEWTFGSLRTDNMLLWLVAALVGWLEIGLVIGTVTSPWWGWRMHTRKLRALKSEAAAQYAYWLTSSAVDHASSEANNEVARLIESIEKTSALLEEGEKLETPLMLPGTRTEHDTNLRLQREMLQTLKASLQLWSEHQQVLGFQRVMQLTLRSIPPWLGGAALEERPRNTQKHWPTKPQTPALALAETQAALVGWGKVLAAVDKLPAADEWKSDEALAHAQALMERARGLDSSLRSRVVECQVLDARMRTSDLLNESPTRELRAGALEPFFPRDIEPLATDLLLCVPQTIDVEDQLRTLKKSVGVNAAHGHADHEVGAIEASPGGRALPARRRRTQ